LGLVLATIALFVGVETLILNFLQSVSPPDIRSNPNSNSNIQRETPFTLPGIEQFKQTVERPVFSENRHPGDQKSPSKTTEGQAMIPLDFKLMGIISSGGHKVALLKDGKGKYVRLTPQSSHGGWQLIEVKDDSILLRQLNKTETLNLLKKRDGGSAADNRETPIPAAKPSGSEQDTKKTKSSERKPYAGGEQIKPEVSDPGPEDNDEPEPLN
jgi:hypothetical protein